MWFANFRVGQPCFRLDCGERYRAKQSRQQASIDLTDAERQKSRPHREKQLVVSHKQHASSCQHDIEGMDKAGSHKHDICGTTRRDRGGGDGGAARLDERSGDQSGARIQGCEEQEAQKRGGTQKRMWRDTKGAWQRIQKHRHRVQLSLIARLKRGYAKGTGSIQTRNGGSDRTEQHRDHLASTVFKALAASSSPAGAGRSSSSIQIEHVELRLALACFPSQLLQGRR